MPDSSEPITRPRPVVLCILDGWGDSEEQDHNAIALGRTPNWDRLTASVPHARLDASAEEVGLPAGQMGNSEVGHMNLGAGRIVPQNLERISAAIVAGELAANPDLVAFIETLKANGGRCHLMGLVSPGGVHSHQNQIAALACILADAGVPVVLHAFLDGRDTPPRSAKDFMAEFIEAIDDLESFRVATVSGRYYAMDRDNRWQRVEKAFRALVLAEGEKAEDPVAAIEASYASDITDEFMLPAVIGDYQGMADGDGLLMANFRADRVRQILAALADPAFDGLPVFSPDGKRLMWTSKRGGLDEAQIFLADFRLPKSLE